MKKLVLTIIIYFLLFSVIVYAHGDNAKGVRRIEGGGGGLEDTLGVQRAAIILINFADQNNLLTRDDAVTISKEVSDYYNEVSYGKMQLDFDIFGFYTIRETQVYDVERGCVTFALEDDAMQAANNDIDFTMYDGIIFIYPSIIGCSADASIKDPRNTPDGKVELFVVSLSVHLANIKEYHIFAFIHEIGHGLGLDHANKLECGADIVNSNSCQSIEYGSYYDPMGAVAGDNEKRHFNAPHKEKLKWLDSKTLQEVKETGDYSLIPLSSQAEEIKALKVQKGFFMKEKVYTKSTSQTTSTEGYLTTEISCNSGVVLSGNCYLLGDTENSVYIGDYYTGDDTNMPRKYACKAHHANNENSLTMEVQATCADKAHVYLKTSTNAQNPGFGLIDTLTCDNEMDVVLTGSCLKTADELNSELPYHYYNAFPNNKPTSFVCGINLNRGETAALQTQIICSRTGNFYLVDARQELASEGNLRIEASCNPSDVIISGNCNVQDDRRNSIYIGDNIQKDGSYLCEAKHRQSRNPLLLTANLLCAYPEYYYLEYRKPSGDNEVFTGFNFGPNFRYVLDGILFNIDFIHRGGDTHLLDMTPKGNVDNFQDNGDSVLHVDRNFEDIDNKIAFTTLEASEERARVYIEFKEKFFKRGDANNDDKVDLSDAIFILNYLFRSGSSPECLDAADTNDDGLIDISDPIRLLFVLFQGETMPFPYPNVGIDPTPDEFQCNQP